MITEFTKANLSLLRVELQAAVEAVAAKHGISVQLKNISFDAGTFRVPLEAKCAKANEQEAALLRMACETYGLDPDKVAPSGHRLVGFEGARKAKPWKLEKDGKPYSAPTEWAKRYFGKAA
jgi:hypothetical protein